MRNSKQTPNSRKLADGDVLTCPSELLYENFP